MACGASSSFAENAKAVGIVNHHSCAVPPCKGTNFRKFGYVAAHGKNTVGYNKRTAVFRYLLQSAFKLCHVAVAVSEHFSVAHLAAGIDTGVIFPVADNIVVAIHQGGNYPHV